MGWLSDLFTNDKPAMAAAVSQPSSTEPYSAIRKKFADGSVPGQLSLVKELLLRLPASPQNRERYKYERGSTQFGMTLVWPNRRNLYDTLTLLGSALVPIDFQRSDMKTLLRVIDLLNETFPATLRRLEIQFGQKNWSEEYRTLQSLENATKNILDELAKLPTTRSTLNIDVPDKSGAKNFPDIEAYKDTTDLYELLDGLKKDWEKAADLPLSAEDDYVIERVGNSYLPDTLLLLDRFSHRTGTENNEKALRIVKEQVALIHEQVLFVLEQNEEDNLDLMEAHTEFLKSKNTNMGIQKKEEIRLEKDTASTDPEKG